MANTEERETAQELARVMATTEFATIEDLARSAAVIDLVAAEVAASADRHAESGDSALPSRR